MNVTLILVLVIMISSSGYGFKKGATKEIANLISWTVTLFVMSLIIMIYTSLKLDETKNIIYSVVILLSVSIVYGIVKIFIKSAKILSRLPVIKLIDKIIGVIVGMAEGFLVIWLLYVLNEGGLFGSFGEMILADTQKSEILSFIYKYNYLLKIIKAF